MPLPIDKIDKIIPDRTIKLPLSWLITGIIMIVSISVGYGGYKTGFENQAQEIAQAKQAISSLQNESSELRYELGRLKQSIDDLTQALDRKH